MATIQQSVEATTLSRISAIYPEIEAIYTDLHKHPELSTMEQRTSTIVADRLKTAGYDVTEQVGGYGVVGLLRNGKGPTVMLRADMDALPVKEKTDLPYASKVKAKNADGVTVPVMHACGHDVHTSCLIGTAMLLAQAREHWRGTLMLVAQPAEETISGAAAMLKDGLFTRFPRPDVAIGQHTIPLPTGTIGYHPGYAMAASDNLQIRLFGKGAHGSMPNRSIDPVVMAASLVMRLQTIVSREIPSDEVAVVSVGAIQAGTRYNIIPDEALLELTVRTFKPEIRDQVLSAITRIAKAEAQASNAPKDPEITNVESTLATYNDPGVTEQVLAAFKHHFGEKQVQKIPPVPGSEDFSVFGTGRGGAGIPSFYYNIGTTDPTLFKKHNGNVPINHSPLFAPVREPSLKLGMEALTVAALSQLGKA